MQRQKVENTALFEQMRAMLAQGLDVRFTVSGHSMWPTITHDRDAVVVSPCSRVRRGDVVLFCPMEGQYLLHRIYKVRQGRIYTCGDGNCFRDGDFSLETVMGRVVTICRKGKEISCDGGWYRLRSWAWLVLYPVRPLLLRCLRWVAGRRGGTHDR